MPNVTLAVTLTRSGDLVVTRTAKVNQMGNYSVDLDRFIEDGDIVQVFDGATVKSIEVPIKPYLSTILRAN